MDINLENLHDPCGGRLARIPALPTHVSAVSDAQSLVLPFFWMSSMIVLKTEWMAFPMVFVVMKNSIRRNRPTAQMQQNAKKPTNCAEKVSHIRTLATVATVRLT